MIRFEFIFAIATILIPALMTADAQAQGRPAEYSPSDKEIPKSLPLQLNSKRVATQHPQQLESASADAYSRGLMPFDDYLFHLNLARNARLSGEDLTQDEQLEVWGHYRDQIAQAYEQLQALNVPRATYIRRPAQLSMTLLWECNRDLEMAKVRHAALSAERQLAEISENQELTSSIESQVLVSAEQLLQQHSFSNQNLGESSLAFAKTFDKALAARGATLEQRIDFLTQVIAEGHSFSWRNTVTSFSEKIALPYAPPQRYPIRSGAGFLRESELAELSHYQSVMRLQLALQNEEMDHVAEHLQALNISTRQQFQERLAIWNNGVRTLSISDLTRPLALRQQLTQIQRAIPDLPETSIDSSYNADLQNLSNLASSQSDLRGRMAADILAVQLLVSASKD